MKKLILKGVEFNNYTGNNSTVQKMVGKTVDVLQNDVHQLILCSDGKEILATSPVVDESSFRAFEFENHNFVTKSGTGYGFSENKADRYSALF